MALTDRSGVQPRRAGGTKGVLAGAAVIGAVLATSCCILPLLFVLLGVSGAWIGNLTALAPYQPIILAATFGVLAAGFRLVYRRPKVGCADGSYCARPASSRIAKSALWIATVLVAASLAINLLAPPFL